MPFPVLKPGLNDLGGKTYKKWTISNYNGDPNNPTVLTNGTLVAATILNSAHIVLRDVNVLGDDTTTPVPQLRSKALTVRQSSHITVEGSDLSRSQVGLVAILTTHLTVKGNVFHSNRDDMHLVNSELYTIDSNEFTNHQNATGDHPDAIQVWADKGLPHPAQGCTITNNCIHRGNGNPMQGVFIRSYTQTQKPGWKAPAGLKVSGNLLIGTAFNAIAVCGDGSVNDNDVYSYTDKMAKIVVQGKYAIFGNEAQRFAINGQFSKAAPAGNVLNTAIPDKLRTMTEKSLVDEWRQRVGLG